MWVFAGGAAPSCSVAATVGFKIDRDDFSPWWSKIRPTEFVPCLDWGHIVQSVKTIVTFAASTSSILAVSWVGLALLGF
jgi:hypothetical protein